MEVPKRVPYLSVLWAGLHGLLDLALMFSTCGNFDASQAGSLLLRRVSDPAASRPAALEVWWDSRRSAVRTLVFAPVF